jgi:hypothetical protein
MKSKESNVPYRFKLAKIDIEAQLVFPGGTQELFIERWRDCKDTKKSTPLDRVWQDLFAG